MKLLVCAHKGEALEFIKSLKLEPQNEFGFRVFANKDSGVWLLITGEGCYQAMSVFTAVASLLRCQYGDFEVFQFGVAGSLRDGTKVGDVYQIRTVYKQKHTNVMEQSSFEPSSVGLDLVTADERITEKTTRINLSYFANLVDREAWGICYAANKLGLEISLFKLVSDNADRTDICDWVKNSSEVFSKKLFSFYNNLTCNEKLKQDESVDTSLHGEFYFTKTQKAKFDNFKKRYELLDGFDFDADLRSFTRSVTEQYPDSTPKKKTAYLLELFDQVVNPHMYEARCEFDNYLSSLSASSYMSYNRNLENATLNLQTSISTKDDRDRVVAALEKIDFEKLNKIICGEGLDV